MQALIKKTRAYKLMKAEVEKNRFSHAYLVLLDDGRNLRSVMKTFAKLFFACDEPTEERTQILSDRIDAETLTDCLCFPEKDKKFMVEDAERVAEESVLKPVEGARKVFIVADFAEANPTAQNKLLKILEEPPENVVFLLGATTAFPILSTVLSRVAKLEIPPFEPSEVTGALRRIYTGGRFSETDFNLCATACGGSVGGAQNILEGGEYQTLINDAFALCLATSATLPALVKRVGETKRKKELLFLLRVVYRDGLVLRELGENGVLLQTEKARLREVAEKYTASSLLFAQNEISVAEREAFFNAVFPQCLEVLLSKILMENAKRKKAETNK